MNREGFKLTGGMPVRDGLVHTLFNHNPNTLRLASQDPNMQNTPRPSDEDLLASLVRGMFVAPKGYTFWARDFTGIEAVLVGYFANSPRYIRLAKLGVHDFFNAHVLYNQKKIKFEDIPKLELSDADLKVAFKLLKKRFPIERDKSKRCVHLSNYQGTPFRMHREYPETFRTVKDALLIQGMYYDLFKEIPDWHRDLCLTVDGTVTPDKKWQPMAGQASSGWVKTPFGSEHEFWDVVEWYPDEFGNPAWKFGEDARKLIALFPQATAAAIMKYSLLAMWLWPTDLATALKLPEEGFLKLFNPTDAIPTVLGQSLRLSIHDEILGMCLKDDINYCLHVAQECMETPRKQLPMNPAWNLDTHLSIGTEAKVGSCWATMKEL